MPFAGKAQRVLSESEAITLYLQASPQLSASQLLVQQRKQLQGSQFNLNNPELLLESPTGEFYTLGVQQSFMNPAVYARQGQLARVQTAQSESYAALTELDVIRKAREAYLALQYARNRAKLLQAQDSVFALIAAFSQRQFQAGERDYLQKLYTELKAAELNRALAEARSDEAVAHRRLQLYTGIDDSLVLAPLARNPMIQEVQTSLQDSANRSLTPALQYVLSGQQVAEKAFLLEKSKVLPGITLGYMNQGDASTPVPLRWNVGVDIPIWFWQYNASIQAAKTEQKIAYEAIRTEEIEFMQAFEEIIGSIQKYAKSLDYFDSAGLDQVDELVETALRMYQAGQTDAVDFLRSLSDAFQIQMDYATLLLAYNQSVIELQHLTGTR